MAKVRYKNDAEFWAAVELSEEFRDEIGMLIMGWANCETWLIHVLATLLQIEWHRARVIFYAFNSSRARVELIQRLGMIYLRHARDIRHLNKLLKGFKAVTKTRNMVCHSEYALDSRGVVITGIIVTNYDRSDFNGSNVDEKIVLDRNLLNEVRQARKRSWSLGGSFERFADDWHRVQIPPREQPLQHHELHKTRRSRQNPKKGKGPKRPRPPTPAKFQLRMREIISIPSRKLPKKKPKTVS
jgi:hypothetical protein